MNDSSIDIKFNKLFINNEWVDSVSGKTFPVVNPATEEIICQVQEGDAADIDLAVAAARKAFQLDSEWRTMEPAKRGQLIQRLAQLMQRDNEYLKKLTTLNNGKTLIESHFETKIAIDTLLYYAGWTDKIFGKTIPVDNSFFTYTRHEPIGVCGQITPWNYPLVMLTWKLGPALACGNTVVLKPSEWTPLTSLYVCELIKEAGFPPGVVNIIPGYGHTAGAALAMHMDVNKIAFTGSVVTGRKIQEASAKSNLKRVSLELGGKSPFIIFDLDDNELNQVAEITTRSIFMNQGQTCFAPSRLFVHENVHDKLLEKLKNIADKAVVGDPLNSETTNGCIISKVQFDRVLDYIKSGKEQGARCVSGGERVGSKGFFVRPTIFADVQDDMRIAKEEIFGPVLSVFKFNELNEVIRRANNTSYGLAAGIYTKDISKALTLSHAIEAGTIWVNCYSAVQLGAPFGGFKQSGIGREQGEYALSEYTEVKNVTIKLN